MRYFLAFLALLTVVAGTRHPIAQSEKTKAGTVHMAEGGEPFPRR